MSETDPIEVSIIAKIQGLLDGLGTATSGVKTATDEMGKSFAGLEKMVTNLKAPFIALAGIVAGGAMFKEAMDATTEWTMEVNKLSKVLNTTTQDASAWGVMLHTLGVSSDSMGGIIQRLQVRVAAGGKAFQQWGIETKNAQGGALPMAQVIENMATKYQSLNTDQEKNAMLQALAGRGWLALLPVMRMTTERMEEAKREAEELHLIVGPEGVAKTFAYQESMRKLGLIQKSLEIQVGNALMPVLTNLGAWLGDTGPGMAMGMAAALKGLITGFMVVKGVVEIAAEFIMTWAMVTIDALAMVWNVADKIAHGQFGEVVGTFKAGIQNIKNEWAAGADSIQDSAQKMAKGISGVWAPEKKTAAKAIPDAPAAPGGKEDKGAQQQAEAVMQAQIAAAKATYQVKKDLVAQELAEKKIATDTAITIEKAGLMVEQADEIAAVNVRIGKLDKSETDYAAKLTKLQAEKAAIVARTEHEMAELTLKGTKEKEKAEAEAAKQTVELAKEAAREQMALSKDLLAAQKMDLDQKVAMGQTSSAQELAARKALVLEEERLNIQAVDAEIAAEKAGPNDPVKLQQMANKRIDIERKANLDIGKLDDKALQDKKAKWDSFFGAVSSGFSSSIMGLIKGTMTWGEAFKNVIAQALEGIINFFIQWGIKAAIQWATNLAMAETSSVTQATGAAAVYAVNAAASVAAIPVTGWAMAPGVGAAAYGQGLAWAGLASFAVGTDYVPQDMFAQIHQGERIVPASENWVGPHSGGGGQQGGAQGNGGDTHIHIQANDAKSFNDMLQRNQGGLMSVINGAVRNRRKS